MRFGIVVGILGALALGTNAAAAQDGMRNAWRAALDATPTPRTLTAEQAEWVRARAESAPEHLAMMDEERIGELQLRAHRDRTAAGARVSLDDLTRDCVPLDLDRCVPDQGGWLSRRNGERLYWQVQSGSTATEGVSGAVVLLIQRGDGRLQPVGWAYGGFYDAPVVIDDGQKAWVAAAGVYPGSGSHNADVVFRWTDDDAAPLAEIDTLSWQADLATRLPAGLEVWKGVRINYAIQYATTPLWQTNDANCCASGGSAQLSFNLTDETLELAEVTVRDAVLDLVTTVPTDVYDYAVRRFGCTHFAGEPVGDAERRAQIEAAMAELRCGALDVDGTALKARHGEDRDLLALIARTEAR